MEGHIRLYLADLKLWVHNSLNDWLHANIECKDACTALAEIIDTYKSAASSAYLDMPEDISLMILTSMDLWVALDKCAMQHYPLLQDYDPDFPPSLFKPLLLPRKAQMERLFRVEQYRAMRRKASIPGLPSIFQSVNTEKNFAVMYFQQWPHHQKLRWDIEAEATNEQSQKVSELAEKRQRYDKLTKQSEGMSCQYTSQWKRCRQVSRHSGFYEKCLLKSNAEGLIIEVHEWPLPTGNLEAKAAVFELDVPLIISKWRDTTYGILVDILSVERDAQTRHGGSGKRQAVYSLHSYAGTQNYFKSQAGQIQLTSTTKPFVVSHYQYKEVSQANKTNTCVNNGLTYSLYDSKRMRWTKELLNCCDVCEKCPPKLPAAPYGRLQYAVNNTIYTSNEVIASQIEGSEALTLYEFYAFGTLRTGHRLQWWNIACELTARVLDFNCHETHALLTQAA